MRLKFKLSLMKKLMSYFLLVIILPMAVLGFISYSRAEMALKQQAEESLNNSVEAIIAEVNLQITNIEQLGDLIDDLPAINQFATELERQNVSTVTRDLAEANIREVMGAIREISEDILILDRNGQVVMDAQGGVNLGMNLSDREYFKQAMQGSFVWSDVLTSRLSGDFTLVYSKPLRTVNEEIAGVIATIIKLDAITDIVDRVTFGETGYAFMIDKNGNVLSHPVKDNVMNLNLLQIENTRLREQAHQMAQGQRSEGYYDFGGVEKFNTFGPIRDWSIAMTMDVDEYMAAAYAIRTTTLIISAIAIAIGAFIAFMATRQVTKPIDQLKDLMGKAEKGDLTVYANVNTKDELEELAASFNQMIQGQKEAMKRVLITAEQVSGASQQTNGIAEEMSSSAENQTAAVEELSKTMGEMSRSIGQVAANVTEMATGVDNIANSVNELGKSAEEVAKNTEETTNTITEVTAAIQQMAASVDTVADNAINANKEANFTVDVAQKGKETVENTVKEMDSINLAMGELTNVIKGLGKAAVQIGDIVEVIDDIAEQTNLLSLNASIEAARAGEHGKGFAVVAGAIGNLAEKSGSATKDITNLIKNIQEEVNKAIETTNSGAKQVVNGVNLVKDTGKALDDIFVAIEQTTKLIQEIAVSTSEQSTTSKAITNSVTRLNDLAMNVSAAMEEQVSSVEEVMNAIDELNRLSQEVAGAAEEQSASSEEILATTESVSDMASEVSAGSQEVASTAEKLAQQSAELLNIVSKFKVE